MLQDQDAHVTEHCCRGVAITLRMRSKHISVAAMDSMRFSCTVFSQLNAGPRLNAGSKLLIFK